MSDGNSKAQELRYLYSQFTDVLTRRAREAAESAVKVWSQADSDTEMSQAAWLLDHAAKVIRALEAMALADEKLEKFFTSLEAME